jgi:hypothetical protein
MAAADVEARLRGRLPAWLDEAIVPGSQVEVVRAPGR